MFRKQMQYLIDFQKDSLRLYLLLSILIFFVVPQSGFSQSSTNKVLINQISFEGNYKTLDSRILREVEVSVGDSLTISQLTHSLNRSKDKITNTGLFTDVTYNIYFDEQNYENVRILFKVKEGLYFIPIPILELADRNFNVWWTDHKRSLRYTNYGMYLKLRNITGNGDGLSLMGQWGYDRKFILNYESPYFDASRKWNFDMNLYHASNKEVIAITNQGKPQYIRNDENYLLNRYEYRMSFTYRPLQKSFYRMTYGYFYNTINDEVFDYNPDYFNNLTRQNYSQIKLEYTYEDRNNKYLATDGWYTHLSVAKNGWIKRDDIRSWVMEGDLFHHYKFNDYWTWNNSLQVRLKLWNQPFPYHNMFRLGGEQDYVRGYEYYHLESNRIGIFKTGIMRQVLDRPVTFGKLMPFVNYRKMNTQIFLSFNVDYGRIADNRFDTSPFESNNLIGAGLGVNFLLYRIFSFSFNANMNQKRETGLFFHLNQFFR